MSRWKRPADWAKHHPLALRLADFLGRGRGRLRVLDELNAPAPARRAPDLSRWESHDLAAAWIGHATVLLRIGGMTVLTDPVLSNRVGVGLGLVTGGPRRLTGAALSLRTLPKLDLILISHAHFDHLDRPTLARLPKKVPVITAYRTHDLVRDLGFRTVTELQWGESVRVGDLTVAARAIRHWGARTFYDDHRGFNAYLLECGRRRVLYGGDTGYQENFRDLGPRGVDLAVLGIGAYNPWVAAHATPEQALAMADHARAERILGMHHSTFVLGREPVTEPLERLMTAVGRDEQRVVAREIGGTWVSDN